MTRLTFLSLLCSATAFAQLAFDGDVVIVSDPSGAITETIGMNNMSILPSKQEQFCRAAFNAARLGGLPDAFDGVIAFSAAETMTDLDNVWQGSPVRADALNYGRANSPWMGSYSSTKLGQCVYMGTLGRTQSFFGGQGPEVIPPDPDSAWTPSLGIQIPGTSSLTGIEMLGHEYGHHWLMGIEFDQNDGRGKQHFIRGFSEGNSEGGQPGSPNQHYSHNADSRSVMYGECITDLGGGQFRIAGCERKYSHIDQYLMGLRAPSEVSPMMVLEDPANPGKGVDSIALPRTSSGQTVSGLTRHDVTAEEIVRAMGTRTPGYPEAQRCWRVAFIVVTAPGQTTVPPAMMEKLKRYQARWGPWFSDATDGRGTMETRLGMNACLNPPEPEDAGTPVDAGQVQEEDAGVDAGLPEEAIDAGSTTQVDAGRAMVDAGEAPIDIGQIKPGCGCTSLDVGGLFGLLAMLGLRRRRA